MTSSIPTSRSPIAGRTARVAIAVLLAVAPSAHAAASARSTGTTVPSRPGGAVYDGANAIRPQDAAAIEALSAALWDKARVAVVVATIPDLGGEPIEDVSIRIAKAWGIGGKEDRGVLVLAAVGDHKARIEAGYGVEGYLPDGLTGEILDQDMIPRFKEGDISGGLRAAAERIAILTAKEYTFTLEGVEARPPLQGGGGRGGLARILGVVAPIVFFLLVFGLRGGGPLLALLLGRSLLGRRGYRRGGPFIGGWGGGFGGGGLGGGGFGGFGGGSFGGGGASRGW